MNYKKLFYVFLIAILVIGVVFRFVNIDRKIYWLDETITSLRISGYTPQEMIAEVEDKYIQKGLTISDDKLVKYQQPNSDKNLMDSIHSLILESPTHTPLYFVAIRFWSQLFGSSAYSIRSFSVLCSIIVLPILYQLCQELCKSKQAAWLGISLMAVSPFFVLYSQEARLYSLWTVTILLSCLTLLLALRFNNKLSWLVYGLTVIVGLYTSLLSILVFIGQIVYVLITEKFKFSSKLVNLGFTILLSSLTFLPWILLVISSSPIVQQQFSSGNTVEVDLVKKIIQIFVNTGQNLTKVLIDFDSFLIPYPVITIIVSGLIIYSLYFCWKQEQKIGWFILTLTTTPVLAFIVRDLLSSNLRSNLSRYFVPTYIGIILALSFLLTEKTKNVINNKNNSSSNRPKDKKNSPVWLLLTVTIFLTSILSCKDILQAETWWNKGSGHIIQASEIINNSAKPLVVVQKLHIERLAVFSLIHHLKSNIDFIVLNEQLNYPYIPNGYSDYFLFHPSEYGALPINVKKLPNAFQFKITTISKYEQAPLFKFKK